MQRSMMSLSALTFLLSALVMPASGQTVISARSGIVHYFEGDVYIGDHRLEAHLGTFPSIPPGAELHTESGQAEVLLTPGVFLRLGENSAIRIVANDLADTKVELLRGSAIVESGEPNPDTSVTLIYESWSISSRRRGTYRIDSDPARLWVFQGTAEVVAASNGKPVTVEKGMDLRFGSGLVPERSSHQPSDAVSEWNNGRSESIIADNAITSQIDEDPANRNGLDSFTYFPILGVSSVGLISPTPYSSIYPYQPGFNSVYGSVYPYQPGFNSMYLPGYMYRPPLLGIIGVPAYAPLRAPQVGVLPAAGTGITIPRAPTLHPSAPVLHPTAPISRPAPIRPVAPVGVHGVGRRR
jgi:hypothetical protein